MIQQQASQPTQAPQNPYDLLDHYFSTQVVPDLFARAINPKVTQQPDRPVQPQAAPNPIPTPTPPQGGQPQPQDNQRLMQAMSLQALLGQLMMPQGGRGREINPFFVHPQQYQQQYGLLTDPAVQALFNQGNVQRHSAWSQVSHPDWFPQGAHGGQIQMDPNILASAAAVINALIQHGGMNA